MTVLPQPVAERVGRILPRLASDQPGEVAATVAALKRVLEAYNLDITDLADHVASAARPEGVPRKKIDADGAAAWRALILKCRTAGAWRLSSFERGLLDSVSAGLRFGMAPTAKQASCLRGIAHKFGVSAEVAA